MMDLKEIYEERRSINFFDKERTLEDGLLEKIVDMAVLAPSAFNLQPCSIIAVKSKEAKQKLFEVANKQQKVLDAPIVLVILGDREGYAPEKPAWKDFIDMGLSEEKLKGTQQYAAALYGSTYEKKVKFAESNAGLLAMSIMYAAKYYGVESHPMSGVDFEGIKREFGIEGEKEVVMLICLWYLDKNVTLYPRRKRFGFSEIVREV